MKEIKTSEGLLVLTDQEYQAALRRGASVNTNRQLAKVQKKRARERIG